MRSSITLYQDQYKLYKTGSKKLLIAFVEYMFEWIEPNLKPSEMAIFDAMRRSMDASTKSHDGKVKWWKNSHGWPNQKWTKNEPNLDEKWTKNEQKMNENGIWDTKWELESNNSWTTAINYNIILSKDNIYSNYYWKKKWIDEKICDKLIDNKLKQWITLNNIYKSMVLYNCECRLKQEFTYVKKFETWIREFQVLDDNQLNEQIYMVVKWYRDKKKSDPKFWQSSVSKTIWNDLKQTFGEEKIKSIYKQCNDLNLTFT